MYICKDNNRSHSNVVQNNFDVILTLLQMENDYLSILFNLNKHSLPEERIERWDISFLALEFGNFFFCSINDRFFYSIEFFS